MLLALSLLERSSLVRLPGGLWVAEEDVGEWVNGGLDAISDAEQWVRIETLRALAKRGFVEFETMTTAHLSEDGHELVKRLGDAA